METHLTLSDNESCFTGWEYGNLQDNVWMGPKCIKSTTYFLWFHSGICFSYSIQVNTSTTKFYLLNYGVWVIALFVFALAESCIYFTSMFLTTSPGIQIKVCFLWHFLRNYNKKSNIHLQTCSKINRFINLNVVASYVNSQNPLKMTHTQPYNQLTVRSFITDMGYSSLQLKKCHSSSVH